MHLRYADDAENDFLGMIDYAIDNEWPDPVGYVKQLRKRIGQLDRLPERGRMGRVPGTLELVLTGTPYIAVFKIDSKAKMVTVIRIRHGMQRWP